MAGVEGDGEVGDGAEVLGVAVQGEELDAAEAEAADGQDPEMKLCGGSVIGRLSSVRLARNRLMLVKVGCMLLCQIVVCELTDIECFLMGSSSSMRKKKDR